MEQSDTTRSRQVHISTNFGLAQTMMFQYLPICLLYCIGISIWLWCSSFRKFIYKHFNILSSVLIFFTSLQEVPAAFVSFRSRYGAANAIYIRQSDKPTEWQTEHAPDPHDVYWPFFSTSFMDRWISKFVVSVASILLILVFLLVSAFVQGLTYMEQLETWLPFLKNILEMLVFIHLFIFHYFLYFVISEKNHHFL